MSSIFPLPDDDDDVIETSSTSTRTRPLPPPAVVTTPGSVKPIITEEITSASASAEPLETSAPPSVKPMNPAVPIGLVVGFLIGLSILVAIIFFFVRRHFIRKRASRRITPRLANAGFFNFKWGNQSNNGHGHGQGDRVTASMPYTKRRNVNLNNISQPTNFSHLESGALKFDAASEEDAKRIEIIPVRPPPIAATVPTYAPQPPLNAYAPTPPSNPFAPTAGDALDREERIGGATMLGRKPSDRMKQRYADLLTMESGLGSHMETMQNARKPSTKE